MRPLIISRLQDLVELAERLFQRDPKVKFAYLFGSLAEGKVSPLSDIDLAVFLDGRLNHFDYRLTLIGQIAESLRIERFDLIVLNNAPLLLSYEVVAKGRLLKDNPARRVLFETDVLRRYLDTAYLRSVQMGYMKRQLQEGTYFGQERARSGQA